MDREQKSSDNVCPPNFNLAPLMKFPLSDLTKAEDQSLARLIVTFALIFNDLKDYLWVIEQFEKIRSSIDSSKINAKSGQMAAMSEHSFRMAVSCIVEFLETVKDNLKVVESKGFKLILSYVTRIDRNAVAKWKRIVQLANRKDASIDKFYQGLLKIRNNGTYHYGQTKPLFVGLKHYIDKKDNDGYVSLGKTWEESRFYFADGAVQCYHKKVIDDYGDDFDDRLVSYIYDLNILIRFIVELYLTKVLKVGMKRHK